MILFQDHRLYNVFLNEFLREEKIILEITDITYQQILSRSCKNKLRQYNKYSTCSQCKLNLNGLTLVTEINTYFANDRALIKCIFYIVCFFDLLIL